MGSDGKIGALIEEAILKKIALSEGMPVPTAKQPPGKCPLGTRTLSKQDVWELKRHQPQRMRAWRIPFWKDLA